MTIRPIFSPSARVRVREPDPVGAAGWMAGVTLVAVVAVSSLDFLPCSLAMGELREVAASSRPGGVEGSVSVLTGDGAGGGALVATSTWAAGAGLGVAGERTLSGFRPSALADGAGLTVLAICAGAVPWTSMTRRKGLGREKIE